MASNEWIDRKILALDSLPIPNDSIVHVYDHENDVDYGMMMLSFFDDFVSVIPSIDHLYVMIVED